MKNIKSKFALLLAAVLLLISVVPMNVYADTTVTYDKALEATDEKIETFHSSDDWSTFAMARNLDSEITDQKFTDYGEKTESNDFSSAEASEYTTALLALESIGRGGSEKAEEITEKLMTYDSDKETDKNSCFYGVSAQTKANILQSLQGQVDLQTDTYKNNKTAIDTAINNLKTSLENSKKTDATNYYWESWGNKDIDTTAAIISALSRYDDDTTKGIVNGAATWLISEKADDSGYGYSYDWNTFQITGKQTNVNSTAMAIIALVDAEKNDTTSPKTTETAATDAVNAMLGHYLGDGTFEYDAATYGTKVSNAMATEQADYALVAYDRSKTSGATSLFDFSDVNTVYYISFDGNGSSSTMKTQAVEMKDAQNVAAADRITSKDVTINANTLTNSGYTFVGWVDENGTYYTDQQLINVSKDIKLYAVWQKLSSSVSSGADAMKTAINTNADLEAMMRLDSKNAVTGTWSKNTATKKWNLFVDGKPFTGGFIIAMNPAAGTYARSGKFYFDKDGNMLTGWQQLIGEDGILHWYYFNPVQDNWYGACYLNTTTPDGYVVDKTGAWMDPNVVTQEAIDKVVNASSEETSATTTSGSSGSTTEETTKKTNKISVSVSVSGNTVSGSEEVTLSKNASAYDALKALAKKMGWSVSGSGSYVKGIGGEMEKSAGAYSGWTYSVNGTTPNKSAGSCKLSDGDSVDWTFVDGPSN